jgi:hypothetical protein
VLGSGGKLALNNVTSAALSPVGTIGEIISSAEAILALVDTGVVDTLLKLVADMLLPLLDI